MMVSRLSGHRLETTSEMHSEASWDLGSCPSTVARRRVLAVCATVAALLLLPTSFANADQTQRPTGWPETGPAVVHSFGSDERAKMSVPAPRPPGCAAGHDCIECVAGCERGARRIVAEVARRGPVSTWRVPRSDRRRDPITLIACYPGGCAGHGSGPLTPSLDIHVTVHKYRQGW